MGRGALSVARLPLLPVEPADDVTAAVFETFRQEGRDPIALYRVLAHSPLMLRAYAGLARGLRYDAVTPRALRELMILRTAQLTGSDYEWAHHRAMAAANDVPEDQVRALAHWRSSTLFDARERAALQCAEEIHGVALSDETFAELERAVGAPETIELVLLAAFYEAVARIIQALGLEIEIEPAYQAYLGERRGEEALAGPEHTTESKESEQ
jgi:alkylhydroperoxidase family enzyme